MFGQNGVDFQKISNSLLVYYICLVDIYVTHLVKIGGVIRVFTPWLSVHRHTDSDIDRHFVKKLFRSQGSAKQIFPLTSQLPYFMITLFSLYYSKL